MQGLSNWATNYDCSLILMASVGLNNRFDRKAAQLIGKYLVIFRSCSQIPGHNSVVVLMLLMVVALRLPKFFILYIHLVDYNSCNHRMIAMKERWVKHSKLIKVSVN